MGTTKGSLTPPPPLKGKGFRLLRFRVLDRVSVQGFSGLGF